MRRILFNLFALLFLTNLLNAAPPERLVIGAEAGKGVAIVDPGDHNKVLWQRKIGAVHDLHLLLPDFHILTQDGWPHVIELDLDKNVLWEYDGTKQNREDGIKRIEIHACQRLPNGNTLIAESGSSRLLEVDSAGKIVKQFPLAVSQSNAHSDTRLVRRLENGNYLIAHEADQTVKEYDFEGKVIWEYQVPLFGKEPKNGHGPEAFGGRCFAAIHLKNGNYLISSGNGHSILEVTPEKKIVWKIEQMEAEM